MTIQLYGRRFIGVSTDVKPTEHEIGTPLAPGWTYEETDTGVVWEWNGVRWVYKFTTREAIQKVKARQPRSSIHQLFGDKFAQIQASAVFLLEDLTDKQGGTSLTNNSAIDLTRIEDKLPLRGFNVPSLNGTSQYFSIPTEAKVEVGTDSFIAVIDYATTTGANRLFMYGDQASTEQNWMLAHGSSDIIFATIDDGTNAVSITVPNPPRDGKPHRAMMFVDRTNNVMYIFIDGKLLGTTDISSVTGTLNNVGKALLIGAGDNGGVSSFFKGGLSNFQLYKDADPNKLFNLIPILSNPQLRESAKKGTVAWDLDDNSAVGRLNTEFGYASNPTAGDYTTTIINTSEGIYDVLSLYRTALNNGTTEIKIDGNIVEAIDHESGSTVENVQAKETGIYLSAGSHILKLEETSGQLFHYFMIKLIKQKGKYNESDEATSGIFFGDEFDRLVGANWNLAIDTGKPFNNIFGDQTTALTVGDSAITTNYIKKGLYKVTLGYEILSGAAKIDLWAGGVKILDAFDMSVGSASEIATKTVNAFLEGDKTDWKLEVNAVGSVGADTLVKIWAIKFELVDGKGNGDNFEIFGADDDGQTVSGTDPVIVIDTGARFNHYRNNTTDLLNDESVWRRYCSGGTFLMKTIYPISLDGGETDILVNGVVVVNNLDQQGASSLNNEHFEIVNLPRGFLDINVKNVLDGATSDFQAPFSKIIFTKIAENLSELDDNSDGVHGSLVPLARHAARKAESTVTLDIADLTSKKFSEIIIKMEGKVTLALALELLVNGITSANYFMDGSKVVGGIETLINQNVTNQWTLLDVTDLLADNNFHTNVRFVSEDSSDKLAGFFTGGFEINGGYWARITNNLASANPITSLTVETSTSTWLKDSKIMIYGVLA